MLPLAGILTQAGLRALWLALLLLRRWRELSSPRSRYLRWHTGAHIQYDVVSSAEPTAILGHGSAEAAAVAHLLLQILLLLLLEEHLLLVELLDGRRVDVLVEVRGVVL